MELARESDGLAVYSIEENPAVTTGRNGRTTDASKLSFPMQLVIVIVASAVSGAASQLILRSEIRDISTRMELQARIDEANAKVQDERANILRQAVEDMKRRQELQQYEIQGLKESIGKLLPRR